MFSVKLSFPAHAFISDTVCSYHSCFTQIPRTFFHIVIRNENITTRRPSSICTSSIFNAEENSAVQVSITLSSSFSSERQLFVFFKTNYKTKKSHHYYKKDFKCKRLCWSHRSHTAYLCSHYVGYSNYHIITQYVCMHACLYIHIYVCRHVCLPLSFCQPKWIAHDIA